MIARVETLDALPSGRIARLRRLGLSLLKEGVSPLGLALAVGLGAFLAVTPFWGLQTLTACGLATLLGLNRLAAVAAVNLLVTPVFPLLLLASLQLGSLTLHGQSLPLTEVPSASALQGLFEVWLVGSLPVGAALGLLVGGTTYALASAVESRAPAAASSAA